MARRDSDKTALPFNPETMTVSDLKKCAHTLRDLMMSYEKHEDDWEAMGAAFAQYADAYKVA